MKIPTIKLNTKYLPVITTVALAVLMAVSVGIVARAVTVGADEQYLAEQRKALDGKAVKLDKKTIELVKNLYKVNGATDTTNLGKADPFAP